MEVTKLLVLISMTTSALAGPITLQESDRCSTKCSESSKFKYSPSTTYVYDYRVDTDSSLAGAFEDSAKTTLQTTANIEVLSPCEFVLQLTDTRLSHTDGKGNLKTADRENNFRSEIEGSPLRFSFQNGIIDHICPGKEDSVRSLNLKKGILSAFQNNMDDLTQSQNVTETDVAGQCKTEYKLVSNGYYTTEVKKSKNILSCTDRLDYTSMLQITPYKVPSDLQNLPLMKTSHECDQEIENGGVLKSAICKESHVYRPFANGESGARTTITQTLTYKTYRNGVNSITGNVESRTSLLFDHSANHPNEEQSRNIVKQKLTKICDTTGTDIRPETPQLFSELVAAMKGLNEKDLTEFHRLLKTKAFCPSNGRTFKFFYDALPMVSTSASVSLMVELINNNVATDLEATAWLTSLAFIQYPTSEMLLNVKGLLDNKKIREDAMLPVSSMINNYCKKTDKCSEDYSVLSIISSLERNIASNCDASGKKFHITLLTLKAIGNAGSTTRATSILNKCLTSTSNPLEIRVAAAEAFRRIPCDAEDNYLWEAFTDKNLDSELRINAYLALMRCPTEANLGKVAAILNAEDDEQVGAFVYSHLTNLRETSDPHKQGVAEAINNLALDKEFDLSPLKYSRNFEVSTLINKINTGITAESNLIWSNKAQLPRAISGNLTVELFGQSINLLDFGGRFEGLEYLIKNIFGPYVNGDKKNSEPKIKAEDVKGSIYGRVFGNEMLFMHSMSTKSLFEDKNPSWLDFLIKLADKQQVALTQNVQFMDICMVIPSSSGLPIHVRVDGTATIDLNLNGKMDLRKVGASPRSMDVDGQVKPSAALEITGTMFVDSFVTKTGLRMRNTLHTSTAMKCRVQMSRGQQLSVELDTPEDKIEIFDARSKFFVLHDELEQEQEMIKENRKEFKACSNNQLTKITGMELCGELSFANASMKLDSPYFPLTGPTSVSVTLFKRDSHSGYKLFAKRIQNKKASIAQISFNTPGSRRDRAISVDMSLNYKKQNVEINLASPWKKVFLDGKMTNLKELKSLSGNLVIDEKNTYAMTGEVKMTQSKTKIKVTPMLEVRRPGADNLQLTGLVSIEKPVKSVNLEMSLSGIDKLPYTVKAALTNNRKEKSVEAGISLNGKKEYRIKASNVMNIMGKKSLQAEMKSLLEVHSPEKKLMALSSNTNYREQRSLKHDTKIYIERVMRKPATLKVNLLKTTRKRANNYKANLNLKSASISGSIVCNAARKPNGFTSVLSTVDYSIPKVTRNTINLSGKFNDRSTKAYKSYTLQSTVGIKRNPEYNSNVKIEIGHKKKLSHVEMDVKYGPNFKDKTKRFYLLTSLTKKIASLKDAVINYKLKAQAPTHNIDVLLLGKHEHNPRLLNSDVKLTYAPKKDISAEINLRNRSTKLSKITGKAALSWPGQQYVASTDLTQKSAKQYSHTLNFKSKSGTQHSISTVYKMPKPDSHSVITNLRLHDMKPIAISGSTNLKLRNFAASGDFKTGQDVYGFNTVYKMSRTPSGKLSIELVHPKRRMTLDVNGAKSKSKYEGQVDVAWDANNDTNSKMTLEGSYFHKSVKGSVSLGGSANFRSPFTNFENLLGSVKYSSDPAQHTANGKLSWGDKKDQITSSLTVKKPISMNHLKLNGNMKTPFKGVRSVTVDIAHELDSKMKTVVKANLDKEAAKLTIQGQSLTNGYKGDLNLKSTMKNAKSVAVSLSHTGTDGNYMSIAELKHNGKVYAYDLNMSHSGNGWQRKTAGDLVLTVNKQKMATHWDHDNNDDSLKSVVRSEWNDKAFLMDLSGSHKLSDLRNINGVLKIKSPWKPVHDIELNLDHKHGDGLINSIAFMKQGSNKKASSTVTYNRGKNNADLDFEIMSPLNENFKGKWKINHESYPMTMSTDLEWAPKKKGTLEGSLNLESWDDSDLNLKLTTPSQTVRNVQLKASNKKQDGELLSKVYLNYGMRQSIDFESHVANGDENKRINLKLTTPFEQIKSLTTGLNFKGHFHKFDSNVDFELLPTLGKFDGSANWQYDNELNGKIRVDTPLADYPYFELSTSSKENGRFRKSHIQAEYYPSKVLSLDSTYVFDHPISFDAVIRSPYQDFDDVGMSFNFDKADTSVKSQGEIKYYSDKKIEAELNADWTFNIESSLLVKTPFRGYESNKISMRHRGDFKDLDFHGEIDIAEQTITTDASFKSGYTTTATIAFTSPIPGLEKIDASLKKKGRLYNHRAGAIININDDKFEANFNNKLTKDSLKSSISLMTPYTETFKFSLDHSGLPESFTNKINVNHGKKVDIDTIVSFELRDNDINGNGILKYKLTKDRNTARVSFSKSGSIKDLTFTATSGFNKNEITVSGSMRTENGIDASVTMKTPFDDFKNTGMTLSLSGEPSDFTSQAKINYMDNKKIDGKLEFSNMAQNNFKLTGQLTTPFKSFESTSVTFNHEINAYSNGIFGNGELTTTIGEFGTGDITYSKVGDLNNLIFTSSASASGKDLATFKLTNSITDREVHSLCSLKSAATPEVYLKIDHSGDSFSFDTQTMSKIGNNMVSTESSMKRSYDSITADSSVTYKIKGLGKNKASISLKKDGDLDNVKLDVTGKINENEAQLSASKSGQLNNMRFSGSAAYNKDSIDVKGAWKNTDDIHGTIKVFTPFEDFKKFGLTLSHSGDLSDFVSELNVNYMDDKKIDGKVELTASSLENIKFMSDFSTSFEGFESLNMKFNNNYNQYTSKLTGNAAIDTSIAGFGSGSIVYCKEGELGDLEMNGQILKNSIEIAELTIKNSLKDQELHSSFEFKGIETPSVKLTVDHSGDLNMKSTVKAAIGKKNSIDGEITLNKGETVFDSTGKVMYLIDGYGSNEVSLSIHKEEESNKVNVEITGKYGDKMSKITGNFKNDDELVGDLILNTPIDGYKNVGVSFKHSGNKDQFKTEGKAVVSDSEVYSGKIDFYRNLMQRIQTVIELRTPVQGLEFTKFEYRHEGQSDSFTCFSSLQYGNSLKITSDLSAKLSPVPELTAVLKMDDVQMLLISGSYENTWPKYGFTGKYNAGEANFINIDSSIDFSNDVVAALTVSTPVEGFNKVGLTFEHSYKSNVFNTEGTITYMDGKVLSGKVDARMEKSSSQVSLELNTPFRGYEQIKYNTKQVYNRKIKKVTTTFTYGDTKIFVDSYIKLKPSPELSITIKTPFAQDIETFVSLENSSPKYGLTCRLSPGNGDTFRLEGSLDTTKDISGSLKIGTPFDNFNDVGMSFIHSGNDENFGTESTVTYMDGQEIFGKVNFYRYMWRRVDTSFELTTPFSGMESTKAEFNFEDNSNSLSTTAALEYNNGKKLNGNVKITYSPNYEVVVTLNTPFTEYSVIRAQGALDVTNPDYEVMCSLNIENKKVCSVEGKFNLYSLEHLDGSLQVSTPLEGFAYTKAEYQHKVDLNELEGSVSITYDGGKTMSCEIKSSLSPRFDGSVTLQTPFRGYEIMEGAASFESSYKKYETSGSMNLGMNSIYSMSSELDYSIEPIKVSTKINTPIKNFQNVELDITHQGGLINFQTTGFLSSPITDHVNAKASLKYDSLLDMSAAAELQSSLEGFDDMKVELKASELAGEMKTSALLGWTSGQQITYEGLFRHHSGWSDDKMNADISILTPFDGLHSANFQLEHEGKAKSYVEKMNFELNGDSLLDFDAEYNFNEKRSAELNIRQPWPMKYTASQFSDEETANADVFINWNRDDRNSNINIQASVTDKSDSYKNENALDISVACASRKVGLVHKFSEKPSELTTDGYIYWDSEDESKVSYELQINDKSRRGTKISDGSFKLGLPTRTLGLTSSLRNNAASVSTNTVFKWDADRDDTKNVGMKTTLTKGNSLKGDITLSMPSMRKEIHVNGEVMVNDGRVVLDAQTDISYSKDASKTLTLISKLEDLSQNQNNFNYSLALGVKHPHTSVYIKMNSHIGSSEEQMTFGFETSYLTSDRQEKNLALLSEINMLKKQINVQMINPIKFELVGDIVSEKPYKLSLLNKINDVENFRSDITIDSKKKQFSFNTFTDSDIISFSAKYPNETAFQVDLTHDTTNFAYEEALLALRLNTSHLLHTRLSWRPDLIQEITDSALSRPLEKANSLILSLTSINEAIAEEISGKYEAISEEISDELYPFISALNEQLASIAYKMTELNVELTEMYDRNDFNVQYMGDSALNLQNMLQTLTRRYRAISHEIIYSMKETLSAMRRFPIGAYYTQYISDSAQWLVKESIKSRAILEKNMEALDLALKEYRYSLQKMKQNMHGTINSYADYLNNKINQAQNVVISPYISSFDIPNHYTNAINEVPSRIGQRLNKAFDGYRMKESINEVYQQGLWVYNYWQLEKNLEKHVESILETLKEIIEEEIKEFLEEFSWLNKNPITVWDPEHGEIQADIPLPVAIKRLDQLPDLKPIFEKAENFAFSHVPDQKTLDTLIQSFSNLWPSSTNRTELSKLKPAKKFWKKGRKYRVKKQGKKF